MVPTGTDAGSQAHHDERAAQLHAASLEAARAANYCGLPLRSDGTVIPYQDLPHSSIVTPEGIWGPSTGLRKFRPAE